MGARILGAKDCGGCGVAIFKRSVTCCMVSTDQIIFETVAVGEDLGAETRK